MKKFEESSIPVGKYKKKGLVLGIGINDADYKVNSYKQGRERCPYYKRWYGMLIKCRDDGTTICDEWKLFMNFRAWMMCQSWQGNELNITLFNVNHFSPSTSCFLSRKVASAFTDRTHYHNGVRLHPVGVTLVKTTGKYAAHCGTEGIPCTIGYYKTAALAHAAYVAFKRSYVLQLADAHHGRIKRAMIEFAGNI